MSIMMRFSPFRACLKIASCFCGVYPGSNRELESPSTAQRGILDVEAVFERLARLLVSQRMVAFVLVATIALALLAPLGPLVSNRFHRDEAIYSSWGLDIASGRDLLVSGSPVDKPPLFLYIQALFYLLLGPTEVAARLPSLIASVVSVGLIYALGRSLYGQGVGLLAAFLLAASPFAILFAPTAFTDPMMVAWMLAGCLMAVRGYWGWAGVLLGLATITKQQGAFFVPLALGLGQVANPKSANKSANLKIMSFVVALLAVFCLAIGWDVARARQPGFLTQSLVSYGGLSLSLAMAWEHLLGFGGLLRYGTSPVLNRVLLAGLPLLLISDIFLLLDISKAFSSGRSRSRVALGGLPNPRFGPGFPWALPKGPGRASPDLLRVSKSGSQSQARADLILLVFIALFLLGHSLVAFLVWDRYLLGLVPLLALLLARVLTLPQRLLKKSPPVDFLCLLLVLWMLSFTLRPILDAAASRFPVGGDHGAYQGIEQVANYLQAAPTDTTLYHRWLGWHWRFYLWGSPCDFRAWSSPIDLAAQAVARSRTRRYVVFPSWRSSTEARLALADAGLVMREVQRAFRDDGSVSFIVYRIEEAP